MLTYNKSDIIIKGEYYAKKVAITWIRIIVLYIISVLLLQNGIAKYIAKDNWKNITIMTEVMVFETDIVPIQKVYMIREFLVGILMLLSTTIMTIIFLRKSNCKIAIMNSGIQGITYWRKNIYIPFEAIQYVYVRRNSSCICVEANNKLYRFAYIENYKSVYRVLTGNLRRKNISSVERKDVKAEKNISIVNHIWIPLLIGLIIFIF